MKYRLNELPVKTTNNFKINDVEVELNLNELNIDKLYSILSIDGSNFNSFPQFYPTNSVL